MGLAETWYFNFCETKHIQFFCSLLKPVGHTSMQFLPNCSPV